MTNPTPAASGVAPAGYEHQKAIQEGGRIGASDAYFAARHEMLDTRDRRNVFDAGFDRGYAAALKSREASVPLTIDQIDAVISSVHPRGNPIYDMNHLRELVRAAAALASPQVAPEGQSSKIYSLAEMDAIESAAFLRGRAAGISFAALAAPAPVAPTPAQPSEWQPIETAPKDGRSLLLGVRNSHGNWRTMRGQWFSKEEIDQDWEEPEEAEPGWYETAVEAEMPSAWRITPTHWMPLPSEPEGESA